MAVTFSNNASSTLADAISDIQTTLNVQPGAGAAFPSPTGLQYFYATIVANNGTLEVVKVTDRTEDTFTIVRGQEGTSGTAFASGATVENRMTSGTFSDIVALSELAEQIPTGVAGEFLGAFDGTYYTSLADSAMRTALGAGATGDAIFVSADQAAAQTALGLEVGTDVLAPTGDASGLTNVPGDVVTTRGDLVVGDAAGDPARKAAGAEGSLMYYDANGDLQDIAPGTDGQLVGYTSSIPGPVDAPAAGGGMWEYVQTDDLAGETELIYSDLDFNAYEYRVVANDIYAATTTTLFCRFGTDASTWYTSSVYNQLRKRWGHDYTGVEITQAGTVANRLALNSISQSGFKSKTNLTLTFIASGTTPAVWGKSWRGANGSYAYFNVEDVYGGAYSASGSTAIQLYTSSVGLYGKFELYRRAVN